MKLNSTIVLILAATLLFAACNPQTVEYAAERLEKAAEIAVEPTEEKLENTIETKPETAPAETPAKNDTAISQEDAEKIALKHAGFLADEVKHLHTERDIDDGIPQYDVQFYHENQEFDYEIHAETGEILSYDRDT